MRIVCISDTHGRQSWSSFPPLPDGDVLIHAGDLCSRGDIYELEEAAVWLSQQRFEHIIAIAGNHDWPFVKYPVVAQKMLEDAGITYLQDSETIIDGRKFYGSPWTPVFFKWAFMANPGEIKEIWSLIPEDVDVLITHGPPRGVLDPAMSQDHAGCEELLRELLTHRIRPKLHVFGHLHEGHGVKGDTILTTTFVNASMVNDAYMPVFQPIVIDL